MSLSFVISGGASWACDLRAPTRHAAPAADTVARKRRRLCADCITCLLSLKSRQIDHANLPHPLTLLRPRCDRPCNSRAAECSQQFPPSDGDCHTPLPCEVRKGNDTTPSACSLHVREGGRRCFRPRTSMTAEVNHAAAAAHRYSKTCH